MTAIEAKASRPTPVVSEAKANSEAKAKASRTQGHL